MTTFGRLADRLRTLAALDTAPVFGSRGHGFQSSPVELADVQAMERELGVGLPADYWSFLVNVGFGAGPYYGLRDPRKLREDIWDEDDGETAPAAADPFPFTRSDARNIYDRWYAWVQAPDPRLPGGPSLTAPDSSGGFLVICHHGCQGYSALVTAGELTGTVWDFDTTRVEEFTWRPARVPTATLDPERYKRRKRAYLGPEPTFHSWYDSWLTACLAELEASVDA